MYNKPFLNKAPGNYITLHQIPSLSHDKCLPIMIRRVTRVERRVAIVGFWKRKYFPIIFAPRRGEPLLASTVRIAKESGTDAKSSVKESSIVPYANPIDEESSSRVDNATSEMKRERTRGWKQKTKNVDGVVNETSSSMVGDGGGGGKW